MTDGEKGMERVYMRSWAVQPWCGCQGTVSEEGNFLGGMNGVCEDEACGDQAV